MANAFKNMDDKINLLAARVDTHDTSLDELEGTGDLVKGLMNALEEASVNNENMRKQHETIRSDIRVLLDRTNDLEANSVGFLSIDHVKVGALMRIADATVPPTGQRWRMNHLASFSG